MKRRLNILCLVVMLVLSYSVLEQGYYIFLGAKMGAQTGLELGKKGSDIACLQGTDEPEGCQPDTFFHGVV